MANATEILEPPATSDNLFGPELPEDLLSKRFQEQEAAEFIARQVLERGATFRDE